MSSKSQGDPKHSFPPTNTALPVISGSPVEGQTLSASVGSWTGRTPTHYAYQWQRGGTSIAGATGSAYLLTSSDVGYRLDVVVTASNPAGASSATSASTAIVMAELVPPPPPPAPTVSGLNPSAGPEAGATSVSITGTNFSGATAVKFGAANAASYTVASASSITAIAPPGTGTVDVTVTASGGTSATSSLDRFSYQAPPPPPSTGFVVACGTQLCLNGSTFRFDGGNVSPECSPPQGLETALTNFGGVEVIRSWWLQPFATKEGARNWTALDNTLSIATAHNVRVIVTLENQWSDCNNTGYKNLEWYQSGYKVAQGGELTSYRQWVNEVVTRYKNNPWILAYQLVNEAEDSNSQRGTCEESKASAALRSFTDDVGGMIHSIDHNHLVDLGTIGSGQCGNSWTDYVYVHASPGTDMCEYHDYGSPSNPMPGDAFNGLKLRLEQCAVLGKPLMVDETGIQTSSSISYEQRAADFDNKFSAQFTAGVVGELVWQFDAIKADFETFDIGPSDPSAALMTKY